MLPSEQQYTPMLLVRQYRTYVGDHFPFFLSNVIITCKIIVLIGLLITTFSDHWAVNAQSTHIYAGLKKRCTVHLCTVADMDPVWLIDIACCLALINFHIEFINILLVYYCVDKASQIKIVLEVFVFFSTFILTDCLIIFGVYILIYSYDLKMGYAYSCFMVSVGFTIIDWGCSLKRLVTSWPDTLYLSGSELSSHNHPETRIIRINRHRPELSTISSSNSITYNSTHV